MNARDRRLWMSMAAGLAAVGLLGSGAATGQQQAPARGKTAPAPPPRSTPADDAPEEQGKVVRVPTNPNDPVAIINGEAITRAQLAEESFIREGEKVLEAMISRKLIDQAMKARKITVTAQEIDAEIDKYANNIAGVTREQWLSKLAKERKISAQQYKNDIVYPGLALRKLAENRVQVSEKDIKDAFEARFGDKLRVRIIMTMMERDAIAMWNELKKNPGGFAHMATNDVRSIDQSTKVHGGLLEQALTRHAYPREVSDRAFLQLVDGDPEDKDPAHRPKDGAITGPIQVTKETWIIMKREGLIPRSDYNPKDEKLRTGIKAEIFEAKLQEAMGEVFEELLTASAVDNKLTGQVKLANEQQHPDHQVNGDVELMKAKAESTTTKGATPGRSKAAAASAGVKAEDRAAAAGFKKAASAPAGVSDEDRAAAEGFKKAAANTPTTKK